MIENISLVIIDCNKLREKNVMTVYDCCCFGHCHSECGYSRVHLSMVACRSQPHSLTVRAQSGLPALQCSQGNPRWVQRMGRTELWMVSKGDRRPLMIDSSYFKITLFAFA
jgi:hypothetical protein